VKKRIRNVLYSGDGMKGLLIKPPWTDMILAGQKTWELRGSGTVHRGEVALIQSGSGTVVGLTTLVDVLGPLSHAELLRSVGKHRVMASDIRAGMRYERTFAWVLEGSRPLRRPVPYEHPAGAVIWVKLGDNVARQVRRARV
jgi:hypothetical protein